MPNSEKLSYSGLLGDAIPNPTPKVTPATSSAHLRKYPASPEAVDIAVTAHDRFLGSSIFKYIRPELPQASTAAQIHRAST